MNATIQKILALSTPETSSREIALALGVSHRYVRRIRQEFDCHRPSTGSQPGTRNHQFRHGRSIDLSGYAVVQAPPHHPFARHHRNVSLEHRLMMEQTLGRYLLQTEVVDHIDGLTLHNTPENLRLFQSNREHLQTTLANSTPIWSQKGIQNSGQGRGHKLIRPPVDIHHQRKILGEIRLRQILLAALKLGIDSPFLSGTNYHTTKAGIDMSSRPTIQRALADLYAKWEWPHSRLEQDCLPQYTPKAPTKTAASHHSP